MNCLSSSEKLSPMNSNSLTSKGQETKLCPCPPVTRSLLWLFARSFHKQALSETLIPTDPCHARKTLPRPHCPAPTAPPQRTIGAVAAIHTGDLAVHT